MNANSGWWIAGQRGMRWGKGMCVFNFPSVLLQDDIDGGMKIWRELARDRIMCSADAALVVLHIITAPHMPKKVHIEESVDQILSFTKYQLENSVYPQFDAVYKSENKGVFTPTPYYKQETIHTINKQTQV